MLNEMRTLIATDGGGYIVVLQVHAKTHSGTVSCATLCHMHTRRRPSDVVPKYQRRAVALWMLMIFGILTCESVTTFRLSITYVLDTWCHVLLYADYCKCD